MLKAYNATKHRSMHSQFLEQEQLKFDYEENVEHKNQQQQQQQQQEKQQVKHRHLHNDERFMGVRMHNISFLLLLLLFILLGPLNDCHSYASVYSAKLDNCYDINSSYNARLNGTAPTQLLTGRNATLATWHQSDFKSLLPQAHQQSQEFLDGQQELQPQEQQQNQGLLFNNIAEMSNTISSMSTATTTRLGITAKMTTTTTSAPNVVNTSSDWKCCCWNATMQNEVECRCEGEGLTRVPQTLTVPVQRLTIATAGLPRVRSTGLVVYAATLMDVVLTDLKELECIQDGAFSSLRLLRTIYISHAPKLTYLSKDVFQGISDTIKTMFSFIKIQTDNTSSTLTAFQKKKKFSDLKLFRRIINSGLLSVPNFIHLPPKNILQMIDLDNNHIIRIEKNSINIKTEQLILANNEISYIDDSAFRGSQIAKLILKENRELREVHPNAFNGTSMQELDLSSTSLVRLPSVGLQDIEVLRIENTYTLKTIPSIYNFKNLQKAYLTHSFHCCAFKYPSRHDPQRHAQRMQEIAKWQERCFNTPQPSLDTPTTKADGNRSRGKTKRSKRNSSNSSSSNGKNRAGRSIGQANVRITIKETDRSETQIEGTTWRLDNSEGTVNMAMSHPTRDGGFFYSRMVRADFDENGENNETELMQQTNDILDDMNNFGVDDMGINYLSESLMSDESNDFGVFHENITINTSEMQLDEYCGNFTFRNREVLCYPMPDALNPCEDVMGYQWLRISVWIVVALAVVGNIAVLMVILSIRTDTSVPRFLMCHLAFADLCLGLYLLLIASIDAHSMGEFFNYAYDWQYGAGCKVAGFLTVFASHLSVFTLTIITIERWLAITQALFLNKRLKLKTATYVMFGGWMYAIFMSMLPLFGISNYSSTSICLPMEIGDLYDIVYLVLILALNGTAFCIIAICYAQIYLSLGQETRHAHQTHTGDMSIAKKMALLVFTNFACCAPIAFFGLTALAGYPLINVTKSKILLVFFYPLNSCADPYLYAILTAQYRQDLYTLLSKFGICKQKALKYKESISLPANCTTLPSSRHSIARKSLQSSKLPETQLMLHNNEIFV